MRKTIVVAAFFAASALVSSASWTILSLPSADNGYSNTAMGHLSDGRFVYGHNGKLHQQDSFGLSTATVYTGSPSGDISFVTPRHVATGAWAAGPVYTYAATSTAAPGFAGFTVKQAYAGVDYDATSLLLVGTNGINSGLGFLKSDGTFKLVLDNFSTYSGGMAMDASGNVFLAYAGTGAGDPLDNNIYKFTKAQVDASIAGPGTLTIGDGALVANLGVSGSLAVDSATNRLYAAGWQINGIRAYDMTTSQSGTLSVAGMDNANFIVNGFSDGSSSYIGWVNRGGWYSGAPVNYGYDLASAVPIPEPGAGLSLALGIGCLMTTRRTRRRP